MRLRQCRYQQVLNPGFQRPGPGPEGRRWKSLQNELAAQVRIQGFVCDKALGATSDKKRSKPDYAVWVLKCSNAVYRVSRAPDMLAKIEPLQR